MNLSSYFRTILIIGDINYNLNIRFKKTSKPFNVRAFFSLPKTVHTLRCFCIRIFYSLYIMYLQQKKHESRMNAVELDLCAICVVFFTRKDGMHDSVVRERCDEISIIQKGIL